MGKVELTINKYKTTFITLWSVILMNAYII